MKAKVKYKGKLVDGCSILIPKTQRARIRKVMGDYDFRTLTEGIDLLLELYEAQR